jgi:isoleucyl-tRNA synthetase
MAITLAGTQPYRRVLTYENVVDETGREMHKSWGNAIGLDDALNRMGADTMRWLYCSQNPAQELRFGYGLAEDVKRRFLTFWNSAKFFVDYANIAGFRPEWSSLEPDAVEPLDRWLVERTHAFVADATAGYDGWDTVSVMREFEAYVDDLSNWYIRRSRRRFWDEDEAALHTLWYALVHTLRVLAPILPFITDELWRTLVLDGPESVHLAGWPEVPQPDRALLDEIAEVRRVVELGRQARSTSGIKLRQPLKQMSVFGASLAQAHEDEIKEELRVKELHFERGTTAENRIKPNLPVLGPRLGAKLPAIRRALELGQFELDAGDVLVEGERLTPDETLRERIPITAGWIVAADSELSVELDPRLSPELELEGEAYELIHRVNTLRKEQGFEVTDRIVLTVPTDKKPVVDEHGPRITADVLAVGDVEYGDELTVEKV